jgi:hypothetical protein
VKPYRRKLSREDADTGTILITKDRWRAFPPPMEAFTIRVGRKHFETRIVAEDCACVPSPHQHYHLEAGHISKVLDFSRGSVIEIEGSGGDYVARNG